MSLNCGKKPEYLEDTHTDSTHIVAKQFINSICGVAAGAFQHVAVPRQLLWAYYHMEFCVLGVRGNNDTD